MPNIGISRRRVRELLEDHVLTRPAALFRPAFALDPGEEVEAQAAVQALHARGASVAGVRVGTECLARIRSALAEAYAGQRPDLRISVNERMGMVRILNPLLLNLDIRALATDRFLCGVVERYLRRRVVLADVEQRRVLPMDMAEFDQRVGTKSVGYTSSHWHRDTRGRQVKVMIYLSDVTDTDSNFAFLPGTHKGHQRRSLQFEASRIRDAWVDGGGIKPYECYGPAGTTIVFDTNAIHRLRRKRGPVRESVTFYYTPGQQTRVLYVNDDVIEGLPHAARALFSSKWWAVPRLDEVGV